jgi:hypothetical protein
MRALKAQTPQLAIRAGAVAAIVMPADTQSALRALSVENRRAKLKLDRQGGFMAALPVR